MKAQSIAKHIARVGLLIAMQIVLSRFLSISTPIAKIGFSFLPVAVIGMLYGPVIAGTAGGIADLLGALLFPVGAYFPGFTLTAVLAGVVYGLFFRNKNVSWRQVIPAVLIITVFLHIGLNTIWLWIITKKAILVLLPPRLVQNAIMAAVQIVTIRVFCGRVIPLISRPAAA